MRWSLVTRTTTGTTGASSLANGCAKSDAARRICTDRTESGRGIGGLAMRAETADWIECENSSNEEKKEGQAAACGG